MEDGVNCGFADGHGNPEAFVFFDAGLFGIGWAGSHFGDNYIYGLGAAEAKGTLTAARFYPTVVVAPLVSTGGGAVMGDAGSGLIYDLGLTPAAWKKSHFNPQSPIPASSPVSWG